MLKGYEVKERLEDGRIYAVVELKDGTTFGQLVSNVSTVDEMDEKIAEAVKRVTEGDKPSELDNLIGVYRAVSEAPKEDSREK